MESGKMEKIIPENMIDGHEYYMEYKGTATYLDNRPGKPVWDPTKKARLIGIFDRKLTDRNLSLNNEHFNKNDAVFRETYYITKKDGTIAVNPFKVGKDEPSFCKYFDFYIKKDKIILDDLINRQYRQIMEKGTNSNIGEVNDHFLGHINDRTIKKKSKKSMAKSVRSKFFDNVKKNATKSKSVKKKTAKKSPIKLSINKNKRQSAIDAVSLLLKKR